MNKTTNRLLELAEGLKADTIKWRRHLHSIPERSFEEHETSKFVAGVLESIGYSVAAGKAGTGIFAEIGSGPVVAIRAELDGLMIGERNFAEYASKNPLMMHACGHDANMAAVLACASILKSIGLGSNRRVRIIMQPASEVAADEQLKSGALRMIEEGALDDVKAIIGMHVDSTIPSGQIGIIAEPVVAQVGHFTLQIRDGGKATEDGCFDPVAIAARIVSSIYDETGKLAKDLALQPITVTGLERVDEEGGAPYARAAGRITSTSKQMFNTIADRIKAACQREAASCEYSLDFEAKKLDRLMNPAVVELMKQASELVAGKDNVVILKRKTWAEDFSAYSELRPGAMILVGTRMSGPPRSHHSDTFDIDETNLHIGAAILAQAALLVFDMED